MGRRRSAMPATLATAALILGAALFWSGLDSSRKALAERYRAEPLLVGLTLAPVPLFLAWYAWSGGGAPSGAYWAPGLASVVLNVIANLAFLRALALSPISITIPLLSLTPAFTALLAIPLLGEWPTRLQVAGIVTVLLGAFLVTLGHGEHPARALAAFRREPGALLMTLVALLWSMALALDKLAIERAPAPFHALMLNGGVAVLVLARLAAAGRAGELRALRNVGVAFFAAMLCSFAGLALQLQAIQRAPVGVVETVKRGTGSAVALLVGRAFFAESLPPVRVAAALLMVGGVACILL
jgi:drug/metabolite transporter (DMT)-like permease